MSRSAIPDFLRHYRWRLALRRAALVAAALAVALPFGCSGEDGLGGSGLGVGLCSDDDGDGFGYGCAKGNDCDDTNAAVGDECYQCQTPYPGCPCDQEGARTPCGKVESMVGDQLVCGQGDAVCSGGIWNECIINNTITLEPQKPGPKPQALGPASKCVNNPCDPYCQTFIDTPGGLTDLDAGIVSTDAGITLPGSVPPAPITCDGGADQSCAHTMCTVGPKLTAGCDNLQPGPPTVVFSENFANNNKGWVASNSQWEIAQIASAGSGQNLPGGSNDPGSDHSSSNNRLSGIVVGGGGLAKISSTHGLYYLTSPALNTSGSWGSPVVLSFWRFLNSDVPAKTLHTVEVCNGASCTTLWQNASTVKDNAWTQVSYPIPPANVQQNMKIRFGMAVVATGGSKISSWNIDDIEITHPGPPVALPYSSCVSAVCAVKPECCAVSWTLECVQQIFPTCGVTCGSLNGTCVTCWNDGYDHDGDGFTGAQGDCLDCDPNANPGAFDFPSNSVDEDCNGAADDEVTACDGAIPAASGNPYDYAKAMELCKTTTLANDTWGVITPGAAFVRANVNLATGTGAGAPTSLQYGVAASFGPNNPPQNGGQMALFSSGTARVPYAAGWTNPNGTGYNANTAVTMPPQFPKGNVCHPIAAGTSAYDSSGIWMAIRVPTNAKSFSFKFNMFSAEYPEWVCTDFNDTFIARLLTGFSAPANPAANGNNISFDANGNPVTINNAFFTVPGCANCNSPLLSGTTLDQTCGGQRCGGATDWLVTTAPVIPGEIINMNFEIWDEGDHHWDSFVVVDDWQWSVETATISTGKVPGGQPVIYTDGTFVRDYDASGVCPQGTSIVWGLWSWQAVTPSSSSISFKVQTASAFADLTGAPEDALQFSDPPGPANLAGQSAVAKTGPPNTVNGSAVIDTTLAANSRQRNLPFLRVTSTLAPSADKLNAPTLSAWNLQFDCIPSE